MAVLDVFNVSGYWDTLWSPCSKVCVYMLIFCTVLLQEWGFMLAYVCMYACMYVCMYVCRYRYRYSQVHIYLDTGTIFYFILDADQNIFKLQLYNEYGLKGTLWALIWFQIGGKVKELQLFNMYHPLFQGTISNCTIDSKAVSWTGMGYSFIISTSIKQVKGLELILSVPFAFGSCCCEPTSCGQRISPYKWNRQLLGLKSREDFTSANTEQMHFLDVFLPKNI